MTAAYDYEEGKKRVEAILDRSLEVVESGKLPSGDGFTFKNAYHSWLTSIFVDIRDSTSLMANEDQSYVARVVRSFTSELIEIFRRDDLLREIGIHGDCVYAIYTTPYKRDTLGVFEYAVWANTYIDMLNKLLSERGYGTLRAGIGVSTGQDHVIKAGRESVGINAHVWMGDADSQASKLSGYGDKGGISRIVLSGCTYGNIIGEYKEQYNDAESWFKRDGRLPFNARHANIIKTDMTKWINEGMPT